MRRKNFDLSTLAPIVLLAVFAISIGMVLLTGAKLYRAQVEKDRSSYSRRTAAQYISMRFKQSDKNGTCFIGDFETQTAGSSGDTLFVLEEHQGVVYSTRIYAHGGYLYELFAPHNVPYDPQDGEPLFALRDLRLTREDGVITADIVYADGSVCTLILRQRSGTEW